LTLLAAWKRAAGQLSRAGVETPAIDARVLIEAAAGVGRADILTDPSRRLDAAAADRLEGFVDRRARREPVSQILGRKSFWTFDLRVTRDVLTPRPETETLVEAGLEAAPAGAAVRLLDLGVGSGAVALAILAERPNADGVGVDISEAALRVARANASALGLAERLSLVRADWGAALAAEAFDLVVCNPPYIPTAEIADLDPEVRDHEPSLALDGGADGLDGFRRLAPEALSLLAPGGAFAFEVGMGQARAVAELCRAAGAENLRIRLDLEHRERVVAGRKKGLGMRWSNR